MAECAWDVSILMYRKHAITKACEIFKWIYINFQSNKAGMVRKYAQVHFYLKIQLSVSSYNGHLVHREFGVMCDVA